MIRYDNDAKTLLIAKVAMLAVCAIFGSAIISGVIVGDGGVGALISIVVAIVWLLGFLIYYFIRLIRPVPIKLPAESGAEGR